MQWAITDRVHYDRVAAPWLIQRFIDRDASFVFVPRGMNVDELREEGYLSGAAIPIGIPGARLGPHDDEGTLFEKVVREYDLDDPVLHLMGEIVSKGVDYVIYGFRPDSDDQYGQMAVGLLAFHDGMSIMESSDFHRLHRSYVLWDAIYALLEARHI